MTARRHRRNAVLLAGLVVSYGCGAAGSAGGGGSGEEGELWGRTAEGEAVEVFTLSNPNGLEVRIAEYGGTLQSVVAPDRHGNREDITLGYDTVEEYETDESFLGALIGRYGNRIREGRFSLDGRTYELPVNNPPNHLHGGPGGFHRVVWEAERFEGREGQGVVLTHVSPDSDEGYPGTLRTRITVTLTPRNELVFDYHATTDRATPVNLTQHSYWNLSGHGEGDILDHRLMIRASRYTPVDSTLIPTGELPRVDGTPFDFRDATPIGARIDADHPQLEPGGGYDHNWVLDGEAGQLRMAARLSDPESGRVLEILTTEPGLQVYTGNWFDGVEGKDGERYEAHAGVALETQHFPDSPNQPLFPGTILRPGEEYQSRTVYRFLVER